MPGNKENLKTNIRIGESNHPLPDHQERFYYDIFTQSQNNMTKTNIQIFLLLIISVILLTACQRELLSYNQPPVARAGKDTIHYLPTDRTELDGNSSTDPDNNIRDYVWRKIAGPVSFNIHNPIVAKTAVDQLVEGSYQFELKVTDVGGLFSKDTVQITLKKPIISNRPPTANAGPDLSATLPLNEVYLNGTGSVDPDNNITEYAWTKIAGPASFYLLDEFSVQTTASKLTEGMYLFELKVTDAGGLFSKDTMQATVKSQPPCDNSFRPQVNAQLIPLGTLSEARNGMAVASTGNKIVFAGASISAAVGPLSPVIGSSRVDIYDVVLQKWSTAELSEWRSDIATAVAGNKIFFAGGRLGDGAYDRLYSTVDIYDVVTNKWTAASLSAPRAYIAAVAVGDKVFFAGGQKDHNYNTTDKVDIYQISSNSWSTATLSEPRSHISAVTVNDKIFFAGGHKEDQWYADPSSKIDIYDNASDTWAISSLNQPMGLLAGIVIQQTIYWAEGCNVEVKDANTGISSNAKLFMPGAWQINRGQNAVLKDGKIIFFRHMDGPTDKFDIYDIASNTWSIGVLSQNISATSIISVNNTIYIAGGMMNDMNLTNQVWKLEF